jgi:hypothetical protein
MAEQLGADNYATNSDLTNYLPAVQVTTQRSKLFALTVKNLNAAARSVWVFDTAAGDANSESPVDVITVAAGGNATREYPGGSLFKSGIYLAVATDVPTSAGDPRAAGANDDMIVKADFRALE